MFEVTETYLLGTPADPAPLTDTKVWSLPFNTAGAQWVSLFCQLSDILGDPGEKIKLGVEWSNDGAIWYPQLEEERDDNGEYPLNPYTPFKEFGDGSDINLLLTVPVQAPLMRCSLVLTDGTASVAIGVTKR